MGLNRYKAKVSGRVMWEEFVWPSVDRPPVDWPKAEERLGWAWAPWLFIYQVWYNQKMVNCFSALLHTHHTPWVEHNFMIVKAWVINIKSLYLGATPRPWTTRARVTPSTRRGTSSTPHFPTPLLLHHHGLPDDQVRLFAGKDVCLGLLLPFLLFLVLWLGPVPIVTLGVCQVESNGGTSWKKTNYSG